MAQPKSFILPHSPSEGGGGGGVCSAGDGGGVGAGVVVATQFWQGRDSSSSPQSSPPWAAETRISRKRISTPLAQPPRQGVQSVQGVVSQSTGQGSAPQVRVSPS